MRSKISIVIALICIILLIVAAVHGIRIGNFKICSISQLIEKNNQLEENITKVTNLTTMEFPDNISKLEDSFKLYMLEKQTYKELTGATSEIDEEIFETKQYDIVYLWKILGDYAKEEKFSGDPGLEISLDVKKTNVGNNTYDFNFIVSGTYTRISQFLVDIENDSELNFRIYNFKMTGRQANGPNGAESFMNYATFTVRNVSINPATIK